MYEVMATVFPEFGLSFEVLYMAQSEHDRHWDIAREDLSYPAKVFRGIHPVLSGWTGHLNPGLLASLIAHPPDVAVIGGFAHPNTWILNLWRRPGTIRVMVVESNLHSAKRMGLLARLFKRQMLVSNDAFIVTGSRSVEYIQALAPITKIRPFFVLPNLINERVFINTVDSLRNERWSQLRRDLQIPDSTQMWLCPARLIEEKGLESFLPLLKDVEGIQMVVAGDGPLRQRIQLLIRDLGLPVRLVGNQTQESMVEFYSAADLFVLPSLRDPSPLSAIEACAASLPLILSDRVGNLPEVMPLRENGWRFDPKFPDQFVPALKKIAEIPRNSLRSIGVKSRAVYKSRFDSKKRVSELAAFLLSLGQ